MANRSTIFVVSSKASRKKQPPAAQIDLLFSHCMTFSILKKKKKNRKTYWNMIRVVNIWISWCNNVYLKFCLHDLFAAKSSKSQSNILGQIHNSSFLVFIYLSSVKVRCSAATLGRKKNRSGVDRLCFREASGMLQITASGAMVSIWSNVVSNLLHCPFVLLQCLGTGGVHKQGSPLLTPL